MDPNAVAAAEGFLRSPPSPRAIPPTRPTSGAKPTIERKNGPATNSEFTPEIVHQASSSVVARIRPYTAKNQRAAPTPNLAKGETLDRATLESALAATPRAKRLVDQTSSETPNQTVNAHRISDVFTARDHSLVSAGSNAQFKAQWIAQHRSENPPQGEARTHENFGFNGQTPSKYVNGAHGR